MKILYISLGCDKNLVDTERMLGFVKNAGYQLTDIEEEADACVINTCCFIHDAKQESIETILSTAELKKTGKLKYLIVTGCLAQRYKNEIIESIPEVDAVLGTASYGLVAETLKQLEKDALPERVILKDICNSEEIVSERVLSGIGHYSYLKIAEGCNKHCTYCVIPSIRGNYRSAPFDDLIKEAERLAQNGINELIVIAQETTIYGRDLYGKNRLCELLHELCAIEGLKWIRLMYCYPEEITDELIETIKSESKICHYLDIPIQHSSDRILKAMGRRTDRNQICDMIKKLRAEIPDIVIRTSLITGFPTETEEDHNDLKEFISEMKLERVGVFTYSKEEGTPAFKMRPQITAKVKKERRKELMLLQQELVFKKNESLAGSTLDCIIDGKLPKEGVYVGRTYMDAPGIDGCVFINSDEELIGGSIVKVRVEAFKGYDLIGTVV